MLAVRDDEDNAVKPLALVLDNASGAPVGWVPDHLLDTVRGLQESYRIEVVAEVVNPPDAPAHLRLLCQLRAYPRPSADGRHRPVAASQLGGTVSSPARFDEEPSGRMNRS